MDQGHDRPVSIKVECRKCRRIGTANDYDLLLIQGVAIPEVVGYFRQILSRDSGQIRQIIVAHGNYHLPASVLATLSAGNPLCQNGKVAIRPTQAHHSLVLPDLQFITLGDAPIVFECLDPVRLLPLAHEWQLANLEQLRRGEEGHLRRVIVERVGNAALLDHQITKARPTGFDCASQPGRAPSNDQEI